VPPGGRRVLIAKHAGDFTRALRGVDHAHVARRHTRLGTLFHYEVAIGVRGDLRQVRNDEHLTTGLPTTMRDR
jgi:hypothetical protein